MVEQFNENRVRTVFRVYPEDIIINRDPDSALKGLDRPRAMRRIREMTEFLWLSVYLRELSNLNRESAEKQHAAPLQPAPLHDFFNALLAPSIIWCDLQ